MNRIPVGRLRCIVLCIIIALGIIVARLVHLQVTSSYTLFQQSKRNYLRFEKVIPPRGNIIDCHGELIATNKPIMQLVWHGSGNRKLLPDQLNTIEQLEALFKTTFDLTKITETEYHATEYILINELTFEQLSAVLELFPANQNLTIKTSFTRYYPYNQHACHILGYLSGISYEEPSGQMGLEKIFDATLRGLPGQVMTTINSTGQHLDQQEVQQAFGGDTIHTTLNMAWQQQAAECFPSHCAGALLVMEARTGALRVIHSQPTFDPNLFLQAIDPASWSKLQQQQQPFVNRALAGCYPPASLFKLITIIAALEQRLITEETIWNCKGSVEFCGRPYHCKKREGHGYLTTIESLAQSCNVPFYEIGKRIKIDTLAHYAHLVGLGTKTTSFLPEKAGLVPTTQWKRSVFGKPWWPGETLSATIGQSFIWVPPIQMCRMIAGLVEGFLVTPRILENEPVIQQPIPISPKTLQFIRSAMQQVIHHGTGQRLSTLRHLKLYGKTGTAQVRSLAHNTNDEHGYVAVHVTSKQHPPLVLVILVEHVGSSIFAVDIAKKFLKSIFD